MPTSINLVSNSHIDFKSTLTVAIQIWLSVGDNGEGDVDHLLTFLLPQYIIMTFSLTALIAYTLHIIS
jgi:hypothetical protein